MDVTFTNAYGQEKNFVADTLKLKIEKDCKITNYDPRVYTHSSIGDLCLTIKDEQNYIQAGKMLTKSGDANFNNKNFSVFSEIAKLDGNPDDLTEQDLKRAHKIYKRKTWWLFNTKEDWNNLSEKGITEIRYDSKAGVETIKMGDELIRIDFRTDKEKEEGIEEIEIPEANWVTEYKPFNEYIKELINAESAGNINAYNEFGYKGLFQFGEQALVEVGLYEKYITLPDGTKRKPNKDKEYNNNWDGNVVEGNKYGITSLDELWSSRELQIRVQKDLMRCTWRQIKTLGLHKYIGKSINDQEITAAGLLGGAHLVGAGNVRIYLNSCGENIPPDGNNKTVQEYMEQLAAYDVSEITGAI